MSVTIGSICPGHPVTVQTTTVQVVGNIATGNTTESERWESGANRWGQVGIQLSFYNESSKEIKYIEFSVVPMNRVLDIAELPITLKVAGPFKGKRTKTCTWNYIWDNASITNAAVISIKIYYMDGTTEQQDIANINYDGAFSGGIVWPIVLAIILMGAWLFGWNTHTTPLPGNYFPAALILSIGAMLFSRCFQNKIATIACSAGAVLAGLLPAFEHFNGYYGFSVRNSQLVEATIICSTVLLLSMLICNLILRKKYGQKQIIMIALTVLSFVVLTIAMFNVVNDRYGWLREEEILFWILYALLFWITIVFVALRCRMNYSSIEKTTPQTATSNSNFRLSSTSEAGYRKFSSFPSEEGWNCSKCGTFNKPTARVCEGCGKQRKF